jgi:spermidine/putrescine transport system ATP-binding protein
MSDRIAVMSAGRILQLGTPREIYTRPANRFVADFIGETNFLPVRLAGATAEVAGATIALDSAGRSGAATVAVRPEHIRLVAPGTAGALAATVTRSVYFGTDSHLHLALSDGTELVARLQSGTEEAATAPGASVGLAFAPGALQVLED